MKSYLGLIDTHSARRADVTPLFADSAVFSSLVDDLAHPFSEAGADLAAGIDALGFILGTAIAIRLGIGFVPIRKGGKIPAAVDSIELIDYTGQTKSLELRKGIVRSGMKVLLVDEWVETGAQVAAAAELIERSGGIVVGVCAINIDDNERTRELRTKYVCRSLLSSAVNPPSS